MDAVQEHGVKIVLLGQHASQAVLQRLNQYRAPLKQSLLVHLLQLPIHKGAHEVAFAELNHLFGVTGQIRISGTG
ncbi:hypothetical protein D1872_281750 [compost metagenome]